MSEQISQESLIASLAEIERYVTSAGWDQPARLFALVPAKVLVQAEPSLADQFVNSAEDALSAIEQEQFCAGEDLAQALYQIGWPPMVAGCALALERTFLPTEFESAIPSDLNAAIDFVSQHPNRQDVRVVVGALRNGLTHGLARLVPNTDELLGSTDLVPGLSEVLLETLKEQ